MFEAALNAIAAWHQLALIAGGLLCLLIGGVLAADFLSWRIKGQRVEGRVVAVRATGIESGGIAGDVDDIDAEQTVLPEKEVRGSFAQAFRESPLAGLIAIVVVIMLLGIPLAFIGVGAYFGYDYLVLKTSGIPAPATVSGIERERDAEGGHKYHAVLSFRDAAGRSHEVRDRVGRGSPAYEVGSRLTVHYEAGRPEHVVTEHFWHNMMLPVVFVGLGAGALTLIFSGALGRKKGGDPRGAKGSRRKYRGEMYYPVFEFTAPSGETVRAEGDSASSSLANKIPGTRVTLLVKPHGDGRVRRPGFLGIGFGLFFCAVAGLLLYEALGRLEVNRLTVLVGGVFVAAGIAKLASGLKPRAQWESKAQFQARMREKRRRQQQRGKILSREELKRRLQRQDRAARVALPLMALIAVTLIVGGYYWGRSHAQFERTALEAAGRIAAVERHLGTSSDASYTYYAVVSFQTADGATVRFRDDVGDSHPSYRAGDPVRVLYDPERPHDARLERGWIGWLPMLGLMAVGALMLLGSSRALIALHQRRSWSESAPEAPPR